MVAGPESTFHRQSMDTRARTSMAGAVGISRMADLAGCGKAGRHNGSAIGVAMLGSALVPSAGEGVSPSRTSLDVHLENARFGYHRVAIKSSFRRDAETSTRDECAPQSSAATLCHYLTNDRLTSAAPAMAATNSTGNDP